MSNENFRSNFYGQLGIRSHKSLEDLLCSKKIDLEKLSTLVVSFGVAEKRKQIWSLLLGVLPPFTETHQFCLQQKQLEFEEIHESIVLFDDVVQEFFQKTGLEKTRDLTSLSENVLMTLLYYFICKKCRIDYACVNLDNVFLNDLIDLAMVVVHAVGPPIYEAFWLLCGIVDHVPARNVPTQAARMQIIQMIEKEDEELYNHLTRFKQCSMEQLVERWYRCWFACVFVPEELPELFDLFIADHKFLDCVCVVLFCLLKSEIHRATNAKKLLEIVRNTKRLSPGAAASVLIQSKSLHKSFYTLPSRNTFASSERKSYK